MYGVYMTSINIGLMVEPSLIREFYGLLQAGFTIQCLVGTSIENLFYEQFGLDSRLVEEKISTIFLDGKPVDDMAATTIHDGSTLALSGAMPGLVGATLRRKSPLASFRQSINAIQDSDESQKTGGYIQIKLFNILLPELGPIVLKRGIILPSDELKAFFENQTVDFWKGCREFSFDGKMLSANQFLSHLADSTSNIFLLLAES
jgi:hypothetical protein